MLVHINVYYIDMSIFKINVFVCKLCNTILFIITKYCSYFNTQLFIYVESM